MKWDTLAPHTPTIREPLDFITHHTQKDKKHLSQNGPTGGYLNQFAKTVMDGFAALRNTKEEIGTSQTRMECGDLDQMELSLPQTDEFSTQMRQFLPHTFN